MIFEVAADVSAHAVGVANRQPRNARSSARAQKRFACREYLGQNRDRRQAMAVAVQQPLVFGERLLAGDTAQKQHAADQQGLGNRAGGRQRFAMIVVERLAADERGPG